MRNLILFICFLQAPWLLAKDPPPNPDFTRGDKLERNAHHDWNLGPTGARGWVYAHKGASTLSRQILITGVSEGSPADGKLIRDDVITGLGNTPFGSDARIALARAITDAESTDGLLRLRVWRKGENLPVELQLPVLGTYSDTAPFDCPKSEQILTAGCEAIARQLKKPDGRRRHSIVRALNAMALLASGDEQYLPLVKKEIEWARQWEISENDLHSWSAGWVTLFLAEYLLATDDESVAPALKRLTRQIAEGQSHVGSWGHRFAYKHNGILRGYGAMNQVGLSLTTAMITSREAGIENPAVDRAIEKSRGFLHFYVGKGALPYGDHHPWLQMHDDNGKASAAAVMFDLLGDGKATRFFSHMGIASYGVERETGHTGNFFNMLWALPGISRSGPEATGAWVKESAWLLDLARTWDGQFDFLGKPGATGSEHSYRGWDCTGAYLIGYAVSKKRLRFTGAKPSSAPELPRQQVSVLIRDGKGWMPDTRAESYGERSIDELLINLGSWSPVVRERAALALAGKKTDLPRIVNLLIPMLGSNDRDVQLGACAAFEQLGRAGAPGIPSLVSLLSAEDYWIRTQAAEALAGIGEPARVAVPALLKLAAEPPLPGDARGYLQRYLAFALFDRRNGLLGKNIESVDRDLLRLAAQAILQNEDGRARGSLQSIYQQLSPEEIRPLLPAVYEAVVNQAPSGVMFSDGIRMAGLRILADHDISEGVLLCTELVELDRWGSERRLSTCLEVLDQYGGSAKPGLPGIQTFAETLANHPKFAVTKPGTRGHNQKMAGHYQRLLGIIEKLERVNSPGTLLPLPR